MRRFDGANVLVTGAASGIGAAVARRPRAEGAHVLAVDRDAAGLAALAREPVSAAAPIVAGLPDAAECPTSVVAPTSVVPPTPAGLATPVGPPTSVAPPTSADRATPIGHPVRTAALDVLDSAGLTSALADWDIVGLDALVHCAGVADTRRTLETSDEAWQRIIDVNLTGTFRVIRASLPLLIAARGAVVTVASIAGLAGRPYLAAYSAAKGGIIALTRSLAVEYAASGVRFVALAPGSVDTPLRGGLTPPDGADEALLARARSLLQAPCAQPEEIAAAAAYLASREASFVTGTVLTLDGGALA